MDFGNSRESSRDVVVVWNFFGCSNRSTVYGSLVGSGKDNQNAAQGSGVSDSLVNYATREQKFRCVDVYIHVQLLRAQI